MSQDNFLEKKLFLNTKNGQLSPKGEKKRTYFTDVICDFAMVNDIQSILYSVVFPLGLLERFFVA